MSLAFGEALAERNWQRETRGLTTVVRAMLLICAVLVALGAGLFFFPDLALVWSDRLTVLLPGNVGLGSAVAWLVKHPWRGLIVFAIGLFILARRLDRRLLKKSG